MTDDDRLADPVAAAKALPRGSLVIVRARDASARETLVHALAPVSRTRQLILLVADDPELALRAKADGLHLPEAHLSDAAHWRVRAPRWLITSAAHSLGAAMRAAQFGTDAVLLSGVFTTGSHPERAPLTAIRANLIARVQRVPVYALGGVDAECAGLLGTGFIGIAAVSALAA